jgi:hypothetical protein
MDWMGEGDTGYTNLANQWDQWTGQPAADISGIGNTTSPFGTTWPSGAYGGVLGMGGGGTPDPQPPSLLQKLLGGGIGAAPGVLGLIGQLAGGNRQTVSRNLTPQQQALSQQQQSALGAMQPGAGQLFNAGAANLGHLNAGTNPFQTQQQSILSALAPTAANLGSGNVQIPPALRDLVRQAYQPYVGDIAQQAIESARNRGFAGGADLLNTGPAGAIAGPALANASGMEANSLLQAMLAFPQASANIAGAYNAPINTQAQIGQASLQPQAALATGYGNAFGNYPYGTTIQGNNGAAMGQAAGQALGGAALGYAKPGQDYQNQQDYTTRMQSMLSAFNPQMPNSNSMYGA